MAGASYLPVVVADGDPSASVWAYRSLMSSANGGGVSQLTAGQGITLSPAGGTGVVQVSANNGGVTKLTAGSLITLSPSGGTGEVQISGVAQPSTWVGTATSDLNMNGSNVIKNLTGSLNLQDYTNVNYATGGLVTEGGGYRTHVFTSSGTLQVYGTLTSGNLLVVGGGGGGGASYADGGGGAGGAVFSTGVTLPPGSISITVGNGGIGGSSDGRGANGQDSTFGAVTANGGGGGGSQNTPDGVSSNGCGGGGAPGGGKGGTGIVGKNGGAGSLIGQPPAGGGGGGMGSAGAAAASGSNAGAAGGAGATYTVGSTTFTLAGGGGGGGVSSGGAAVNGGGQGGMSSSLNGTNGTAYTGGGGGGGGGGGIASVGGNGGSGIVIVSYPFSTTSSSINLGATGGIQLTSVATTTINSGGPINILAKGTLLLDAPSINTNNNPLLIRDQYSGLVWGYTAPYNLSIDGPYLFGYSGGAVGTTGVGSTLVPDISFRWDRSNLYALKPLNMLGNSVTNVTSIANGVNGVGVNQTSPVGQLHVKTSGDAIIDGAGWDTRWTLITPAANSSPASRTPALGLGYSVSTNRASIASIEPFVAFKDIEITGLNIYLSPQNGRVILPTAPIYNTIQQPIIQRNYIPIFAPTGSTVVTLPSSYSTTSSYSVQLTCSSPIPFSVSTTSVSASSFNIFWINNTNVAASIFWMAYGT